MEPPMLSLTGWLLDGIARVGGKIQITRHSIQQSTISICFETSAKHLKALLEALVKARSLAFV